MKTFKDNQSREWQIAVNVASIKRVRDLLAVDLLSVVEDKSDLMARLTTDPVLMVDVVYAICKPQADARNVTDEQFGEAMGGDSLDGAYAALLDEIADFFRGPQRGLLKKAMAKLAEVETRAVAHANAKLDAVTPDEMDRLLKSSGDSSTSAPESSESTQAT